MIDPSTIELEEFLLRWYGPGGSPAPAPPTWLPGPLQRWYELTARHAEPHSVLKRFRAPEEIRAEDGKAIFMVDPTGDWRWAFDVEEPDVVYDAELYEEWRRNEESLEQILTHHAVQEAVFGARRRRRNTHVPEALAPDALAGLEQIDFPAWRWYGAEHYRYFIGDLVIAEVVPDYGPAGYYQIQVSSPDGDRLSYLDGIAGIEWDRAGE